MDRLSNSDFTEEWIELLKQVYGIQSEKLSFNHEGETKELRYCTINSRVLTSKCIATPFFGYSYVQESDQETDKELEESLKEAVKQEKVGGFEIRPPADGECDFLENSDLDRSENYHTYIIDLTQEEDEIMSNMKSNRRRAVKKGRDKQPITVETAESKEALEEFYRLYLKTMKRHGTPPHSYKFFEEMWNRFYPENMEISKTVHEEEEKVIAANIYFKLENKVLYSRNGADEDYFNLRSNDLMHWRMIQEAKEEGYSEYDFGRTRADTGVDSYKKRWGGEKKQIPYYYHPEREDTTPQEEKKKFQIASDIWSDHVPNYIAKKIGPHIRKRIG